MWPLVKLVAVALAGYAVYTAPLQDQIVMAEGARALGRSLVAACTRPGSPCRQLFDALHSLPAEPTQGQLGLTHDPAALPRQPSIR